MGYWDSALSAYNEAKCLIIRLLRCYHAINNYSSREMSRGLEEILQIGVKGKVLIGFG